MSADQENYVMSIYSLQHGDLISSRISPRNQLSRSSVKSPAEEIPSQTVLISSDGTERGACRHLLHPVDLGRAGSLRGSRDRGGLKRPVCDSVSLSPWKQEGAHRFECVTTRRSAPALQPGSVPHLCWLPAAERAVGPKRSCPEPRDLKQLPVSQAPRVLARSPSRRGAGRLQLRS